MSEKSSRLQKSLAALRRPQIGAQPVGLLDWPLIWSERRMSLGRILVARLSVDVVGLDKIV